MKSTVKINIINKPLQMDANPVPASGRLEKHRGGAVDEIPRISRQRRVIAGQLNSNTAAREGQSVVQLHRLHDGFQLVKAIRPPAENVQQIGRASCRERV